MARGPNKKPAKREPATDIPAHWPADKVERWPIDKLLPYARNSNDHTEEQIEQVAASIRQWGWTIPVLVDEGGVLIAGHARVQAAVRLGIEAVPTMVAVGWSEEQRRAYVIADNQLARNSQWNIELLAEEAKALNTLGFDLSLTGLSSEDVSLLLEPVPSLTPPGAFREFGETIPTEYCCPRCQYVWSGKAKGAEFREEAVDGSAG